MRERKREDTWYTINKLITLNKTRSYGTFKVNINDRTSAIKSSQEYMEPLKEVVRLHLTEAIKVGWLTGSSDLWRQQTDKCLFLSVNKGEQKQLATEEIKRAADNACLFSFLMPVGGGHKTCVAMFLLLGVTERILCVFI